MASRLLNVLDKLESERRLQIETARGNDLPVSDDASFTDLSTFIGSKIQGDMPPSADCELEDWIRPEEWPDCEDILENAEDKDGFSPGVIMLLDATKETQTLLPAYGTTRKADTESNPCASGYLTSDGVWYNDTTSDITHVWDTTQDIEVTGGKFPGRYRWIICYYDSNKYVNHLTLGSFYAVEIIVGRLATHDPTMSTNPNVAFCICPNNGASYSWNNLSITLINFKIASYSNLRKLYWTYSSCNFFANFPEIRNIDLGNIVQDINAPTSNSNIFPYGDPKLRKLDLSKQRFMSTVTVYLNGCKSLISYKAPSGYSGSIYYYGLSTPQLMEIIAPNSTLRFNGTVNYISNKATVEVKSMYNTIPVNWTKMLAPLTNDTNINSLASNALSLTTLDLRGLAIGSDKTYNDVVNTTIESYLTIGNNCPNLVEVIIPEGWRHRTDLSSVNLLHSSIVDIFENLVDLTGLTTYYPYIKLGHNLKDIVTAEDLAIATNKGWAVTFK